MSRYIIEVIDGWKIPSFEAQRMAYVYERDKGWPTQRQKPVITFVGDDDTQALAGVHAWMEQGKPSRDEIKARSTAVKR